MTNLVEDYKILRNQVDSDISDDILKRRFRDCEYNIVKTILSFEKIENDEKIDDDSKLTEAQKKIKELREIANIKDVIFNKLQSQC